MLKVYYRNNNGKVYFRGVGDSKRTVSLARSGDHCFYTVGNFHMHNEHAPRFHDHKELEDYVERVKGAVLAAGDAGVEGEDVYKGREDWKLLVGEVIPAPKVIPAPQGSTVVCIRCGHAWEPRVAHPVKCAKCKSKKWAA